MECKFKFKPVLTWTSVLLNRKAYCFWVLDMHISIYLYLSDISMYICICISMWYLYVFCDIFIEQLFYITPPAPFASIACKFKMFCKETCFCKSTIKRINIIFVFYKAKGLKSIAILSKHQRTFFFHKIMRKKIV